MGKEHGNERHPDPVLPEVMDMELGKDSNGVNHMIREMSAETFNKLVAQAGLTRLFN